MESVLARHGRKAEVGNDEPLGGDPLIVIAAGPAGGLGRHHVEAGRELAEGLVDGEGRRHLLVEGRWRLECALPDLGALAAGETVGRVAVDLGEEIGAQNIVHQGPVADPVEGKSRLLAVDGEKRHAVLARSRQHIALAGKAHGRAPVADVDAVFEVADEVLLDRRRQALAGGDGVALAVLQPLDAEPGALGGHRRHRSGIEAEVGGEIGNSARRRVRHLEADARRHGVVLDAVVGDAESMIGAGLLVGGADRRVLG